MGNFFSLPTTIASLAIAIPLMLLDIRFDEFFTRKTFLKFFIFYIISVVIGLLILFTFNDDNWKCGDNGQLSIKTDADKENLKNKTIASVSSTWIIPVSLVILAITAWGFEKCGPELAVVGDALNGRGVQAFIMFLIAYIYYGIYRTANC